MPGDAASIKIAEINKEAMLGSAGSQANSQDLTSARQQQASQFASNNSLQASNFKSSNDLAASNYAADRGVQNAKTNSSMGFTPNTTSSTDIVKQTLNGFAHGTAKVPGHGDGTVDTVDAKLAPGEAVLNKAAAEMLGRGLIDLLNKHGMLKMGMPEPDGDEASAPQQYAKGTSRVMC